MTGMQTWRQLGLLSRKISNDLFGVPYNSESALGLLRSHSSYRVYGRGTHDLWDQSKFSTSMKGLSTYQVLLNLKPAS